MWMYEKKVSSLELVNLIFTFLQDWNLIVKCLVLCKKKRESNINTNEAQSIQQSFAVVCFIHRTSFPHLVRSLKL